MSESKHIYIIYRSTNLVNKNFYVGFHKQKKHFPVLFDGYLGSGLAINNAVKKYGKEHFERVTLFVYNTKEEAFAKEKEIVTVEFIKRKDTYNIAVGGSGATETIHTGISKQNMRNTWTPERRTEQSERMKHRLISDATKEKIRQSKKGTQKGENNSFYGKNHTKETKIIIGNKSKGRKHTEEVKNDMSINRKDFIIIRDKTGKCFRVSVTDERYLSGELIPATKGISRNNDFKENIRKRQKGENNSFYGKNHTKETKILLSKKLKGQKRDDIFKNKMSELALNRPKYSCPYCDKVMDKGNYTRYHGDKCKFKV